MTKKKSPLLGKKIAVTVETKGGVPRVTKVSTPKGNNFPGVCIAEHVLPQQTADNAVLRGLVDKPAPTVTPKPMLQQAQETISGPREQEYGNKLQNFSQISMIWQGILAPKMLPDSVITPEDVALLMIGVKMARLAKSPDHFDSILDVAGYAGCYSHLQEDRSAGKELLGATVDFRR